MLVCDSTRPAPPFDKWGIAVTVTRHELVTSYALKLYNTVYFRKVIPYFAATKW